MGFDTSIITLVKNENRYQQGGVIMTLYEGKIGEAFTVINIDTDTKIKKRLQDMGLTKGVNIKIMSKYSNSAFILNIRGSRVVLGKDITSLISVLPNECNSCEKRIKQSKNNRHGRRGIVTNETN